MRSLIALGLVACGASSATTAPAPAKPHRAPPPDEVDLVSPVAAAGLVLEPATQRLTRDLPPL